MLYEQTNTMAGCYPTPPEQLGQHRATLIDRLNFERTFLAERLAKVDAALEALDSNPEFSALLQLVQDVA